MPRFIPQGPGEAWRLQAWSALQISNLGDVCPRGPTTSCHTRLGSHLPPTLPIRRRALLDHFPLPACRSGSPSPAHPPCLPNPDSHTMPPSSAILVRGTPSMGDCGVQKARCANCRRATGNVNASRYHLSVHGSGKGTIQCRVMGRRTLKDTSSPDCLALPCRLSCHLSQFALTALFTLYAQRPLSLFHFPSARCDTIGGIYILVLAIWKHGIALAPQIQPLQ